MKINVKIQDTQYEVIIENIKERPVKAVIEGETFEVWPEEPQQSTVPQNSMPATHTTVDTLQSSASASSTAPANNELRAPIPGVIIDILVKKGESVETGQELCILEAMKMKNSIRANHACIIDEIAIRVGDQVQHGQILFSFKD